MKMRVASLVFVHRLLPVISSTSAVTPVEKVITLLEDLKAEAEAEGAAEATTYDKFACFCKTNTEEKSTSIVDGRDKIDGLSSDIQEKTADKEEKVANIGKRKQNEETMAAELAATKSRLAKEQTEYETTSSDLSKAISSLESAISAMQDSKPASESELISIRRNVKKSLEIAEILNGVDSAKHKIISNFLQKSKVNPDDADYSFHSQEIIDVMQKLLQDFNTQKSDLTTEWEKTETAENNLITDIEGKMEENTNMIDTLDGDVTTLTTEIAQARENLVDAESLMKDDQLYLKDLTARCEQRAASFDQRSHLRGEEIKALSEALTILTERVQTAVTAGNSSRALLQSNAVGFSSKLKIISFMQRTTKRKTLLERHRGLLADQQKERVLALLRGEGQRIGSVVLSSLAMKVAADPFTKVKKLIQELIQRLITEATAEAEKKGYCDLEVSKAEKHRNHRWADVKRLNAQLSSLEAKEDSLEEEITSLNEAISSLTESLENATTLRGDAKQENLATLKDAKEGLKAVSEALLVLKVFYKQAAKAKVLLQASPVDEDDPGAASEAYQGKQGAATAILGLLEVIKSDFQRTIKNTETEEATEASEFVRFERTSKADIGGKQTKVKLDEEDLASTKTKIGEATADLKKNMDLTDAALLELKDLQPMCIDTGMSYEERVAKRDEEIAALKRAVCILDTDKVEEDCKEE